MAYRQLTQRWQRVKSKANSPVKPPLISHIKANALCNLCALRCMICVKFWTAAPKDSLCNETRHSELWCKSVINECQLFLRGNWFFFFLCECCFGRRALWQAGTWLDTQDEQCGLFTDRHLRIWACDTQMFRVILAQPTTGTLPDYIWETRLDKETHTLCMF